MLLQLSTNLGRGQGHFALDEALALLARAARGGVLVVKNERRLQHVKAAAGLVRC